MVGKQKGVGHGPHHLQSRPEHGQGCYHGNYCFVSSLVLTFSQLNIQTLWIVFVHCFAGHVINVSRKGMGSVFHFVTGWCHLFSPPPGFQVQDALCVRPFPHQRGHPGGRRAGRDQELPGREVHPSCSHESWWVRADVSWLLHVDY